MPDTTPLRGYPFPLDSDPIDVAGDIQQLAEAIDADVGDIGTAIASYPRVYHVDWGSGVRSGTGLVLDIGADLLPTLGDGQAFIELAMHIGNSDTAMTYALVFDTPNAPINALTDERITARVQTVAAVPIGQWTSFPSVGLWTPTVEAVRPAVTVTVTVGTPAALGWELGVRATVFEYPNPD